MRYVMHPQTERRLRSMAARREALSRHERILGLDRKWWKGGSIAFVAVAATGAPRARLLHALKALLIRAVLFSDPSRPALRGSLVEESEEASSPTG